MRNVIKSVLAAGAILTLGTGATMAVVSDAFTIQEATIVAGNLDLDGIGPMTWADITPGRTSHPIDDLSTWRMIPGDAIAGTQKLSIALEGDNMVATLSLIQFGVALNLPAPSQGVTITYDVLNAQGVVVANDVKPIEGVNVKVQAGSAGQAGGVDDSGIPIITTTSNDGTADLLPDATVVIVARFDANTPARVRTQAMARLSDMQISLTQTAS